MYNFTIPMALMDFVPVVFFGVSAVILLRDLYNKMFKGAYALLAAGCVIVFTAGFCKALWKLLYAANICDFVVLEKMFLPVVGKVRPQARVDISPCAKMNGQRDCAIRENSNVATVRTEI